MSEINNENVFTTQEEDEINIRELFFRYLRYWYVFLFALGVSLVGAYVYNRYSTSIYSVTSKVLVQDSKKTPAGSEILKELDIFKSGGIVENEIEIIHSRPVIAKALDNLNFGVSYFGVGDIKTSELYGGKIPFRVIYDTLPQELYNIPHKVYFQKDGQIMFTVNETTVAVRYNEPVSILSTKLTFVPNTGFDQNLFLEIGNDIDRDYLVVFHRNTSLVENFFEDLKVVAVNKLATVLELSIKTTVPEKGQDFLNEITKVYIKNGVDQKSEMAAHTLEFIKERLSFVSGDLTTIESEVEQYKIKRGIANVGEESKFLLESVKEYDKELSKISMELEYVNQIYNNLSREEYKAPPFIGTGNTSLEKLIGDLYNLEALKINYETTVKNDNPLNTILRKQIETAKENIRENISSLKESLNINQQQLKDKLSIYEQNIEKVPTIERDLLSIERQKLIKENLYLYLLQKQEESAIALAAMVSDNKIIEPAHYLDKPIKPVKHISYLIALIIGIGLPALFIYLKDLFNDKVVSKITIEKNAKAPIIGVVGQSASESSITVHSKAKSAISEEFRSIRTNLQFMGVGVKEKVMLVTSSISGEGKTFISLNLALTFAISGKKTVVLEMDLRKPKLTRSFENRNPVGISNYLIGMASFDEIISKSEINEHLYIISSGPIPPNPAELLMSNQLKELIINLRNNFDIIIIDSPPIGLVTDSLIIAEHIDASLYIVRQSRTPKSYMFSIADIYQNKKMKKLSIVFNGIDRKLGNYGYGYGYGYGYYSEDNKREKSFLTRLLKYFSTK
jgi:tyrosine-protein kinase Etk/Wzc